MASVDHHPPSQQPTFLQFLLNSPGRLAFMAVALVLGLAFAVFALQSGFGTATFWTLALGDAVTGSPLKAHSPALMWALWGLILGASLGFWLEAPLYGLRQMRPLVIAIPLVLMAGVAVWGQVRQGAAPALGAPQPPPPPPPIAPNFAGTWNTNWGDMTLQQDGDQVRGAYTYRNGTIQGSVRRASDSTLVLNYYWANENGGSQGVGFFALAADAKTMKGDYNESANFGVLDPNSSRWTGTRTSSPPPPPTFNGEWNTNWGSMHLAQGVSTVNGTYEYGGGLIEGDLATDGKTLTFRWTNRVTGEKGTGKIVLGTFGQTFSGTWTPENSSSPVGEPWTGQRVGGTQ